MLSLNQNDNITSIKDAVLCEVARLAYEGTLDEKKENLPFEMIPGPKANFRCCIYKEREIIRQRIRMAEGKAPGRRKRRQYRPGHQLGLRGRYAGPLSGDRQLPPLRQQEMSVCLPV